VHALVGQDRIELNEATKDWVGIGFFPNRIGSEWDWARAAPPRAWELPPPPPTLPGDDDSSPDGMRTYIPISSVLTSDASTFLAYGY
jgi:hypothetical protein